MQRQKNQRKVFKKRRKFKTNHRRRIGKVINSENSSRQPESEALRTPVEREREIERRSRGRFNFSVYAELCGFYEDCHIWVSECKWLKGIARPAKGWEIKTRRKNELIMLDLMKLATRSEGEETWEESDHFWNVSDRLRVKEIWFELRNHLFLEHWSSANVEVRGVWFFMQVGGNGHTSALNVPGFRISRETGKMFSESREKKLKKKICCGSLLCFWIQINHNF